MPMVQYWKRSTSVQAKVTTSKDGSLMMHLDGEAESFPGFPRGHLLFGKLSKLKHEIKTQVFNESWHLLESGVSELEVMEHIRNVLSGIYELAKETEYDRVPPSRMCLPVRELFRAWTKTNPDSWRLRDIVCFIFQEDDSYRFRFQWMASYFFRLGDVVKNFDKALAWLERAEVIDDMKERERLFRRIVMVWIRSNQEKFRDFVRECDWSKVRLRRADKFHFRGKYFKVDLDKFEY